MRSIWRTLDRRLARQIGLVLLADTLVGASFGAIAVGSGFPLWVPMLLSVAVFGGASQFLFIGIVAAGGAPFAAVLAGLLVNARHLPFGLSVVDALGTGRLRRLLGAHLMIDESVAFALAQPDLPRKRAAYWCCGIGLFGCWNAGVLLGGIAGDLVASTDALGLDAAFPAVLIALALPSLRTRGGWPAAVTGVAVSLLATPFLPAGVPILLALAGVPLVLLRSADRAPTSVGEGR